MKVSNWRTAKHGECGNISLASKRFARKWAIYEKFSIFTWYCNTSQKFNDMKMRFELLHQIKFGQQVLPLWFRSVNWKMTTQELLSLQATNENVSSICPIPRWVVCVTQCFIILFQIIRSEERSFTLPHRNSTHEEFLQSTITDWIGQTNLLRP